MLLIADTSPLNYLAWIEAVEILPQLYGKVVIPPEVRAELLATDNPAAATLSLALSGKPYLSSSACSFDVAAGCAGDKATRPCTAQLRRFRKRDRRVLADE